MAATAKFAECRDLKEKCKTGKVEYFDGVYWAPIDKLGIPGRWVRHKLLEWILTSTVLVTHLQACRKPWLDKLMHLLSFMGTEEFYTPIVVLLEWVIDIRLARLFTILMGAGFYFTTVMKNMLRLPRPPSPPVKVLEVTSDWSLPSLHAVIGVMLPWYICIYIYQHYQLMYWEVYLMVTIIFFWSTSVSLSRLYLGVHSPADILAGIVPGTIMLAVYVHFDDSIDTFITSGNFVALKSFLFYTTILAIHPSSGSPTSSYGEAIITNSVALGFVLATTRTVSSGNYYHALMEQAERAGVRTTPSMHLVVLGTLRVLLGFPIVLIVRVIFKTITSFIVRWLCSRFNIASYSNSQHCKTTPQLNKHHTPGYRLPPITRKEKSDDGGGVAMSAGSSGGDGRGGGGDEGRGDGGRGVGEIDMGACDANGPRTTAISQNGDVSQNVDRRGRGSLAVQGSMPLDVDAPTKFVTYTMMAWVATEWMHVCFHQLGLHMMSR